MSEESITSSPEPDDKPGIFDRVEHEVEQALHHNQAAKDDLAASDQPADADQHTDNVDNAAEQTSEQTVTPDENLQPEGHTDLDQSNNPDEPHTDATSDAHSDAESTLPDDQRTSRSSIIQPESANDADEDSDDGNAQPGLSPAFNNSDLMTTGINDAPNVRADQVNDEKDNNKPRYANHRGSPIADAQPTDQAKGLHDSEDLVTCPVCQAKFEVGAAVL